MEECCCILWVCMKPYAALVEGHKQTNLLWQALHQIRRFMGRTEAVRLM